VLADDEIVTVASGVANVATGAAMTTDTAAQVASVTKTFTAALVLTLLHEQGLSVDTPAVELIPELAGAPLAVTVRRLLDHTSGLQGDLFDDMGANPDALERYVRAAASLGQLSPPGLVFSYCNSGYVALGRLVEHLAGRPFDRVLRERIAGPLGLRHTTLRLEEAVLGRIAVGHDLGPDGPLVRPWIAQRGLWPTGAVISTVDDLLGWAGAHLSGGGEVLPGEVMAAMRTWSTSCPDPWTAGPGWGLGFTVCTGSDGEPVYGHDGLGVGLGAYLRIVPGRNWAVAMLGAAGHARLVWQEVWPALLADEGMRMPSLPQASITDADVDHGQVIGTYERHSQRVEVVDGPDGLLMTSTPTGVLARFSSPVSSALRPVRPGVFAARAATGVELPVVFLDADGDVVANGAAAYLHTGMRAAARVG
jgi:CubicO group peptidase (beta-lactamase class C family)